jgi:adenylylsulfate kinase
MSEHRDGGVVVWITGRPATGKSTLARGVLAALEVRGRATLWIDSDDLRPFLTPNPDYSDAERDRFYAALGHLARRAAEGGVVAVVSATASKRSYRDEVRLVVPRFLEIWLTCDPEELRRRDVKGLYKAAEAGTIPNLPGVGAEYEPPKVAELVLDTSKVEPEKAVEAVLRIFDAKG